MSKVLVIEDDLSVVQGLLRGLRKGGFQTTLAMDGDEGLALALKGGHDVILLDLMLPGRSGFEILEALAGRSSTPIVVLSARHELPARLKSFEFGAVDFVPKPFWMEELLARLRSRLAIPDDTPRRCIELGPLVVDLDGRRVVDGEGAELAMTAHEFNVLAYLVERPNRALSRAQIAQGALPEEGDRLDRTVDSHVSRIRKKLGSDLGSCIQTVWGIGYRFIPPKADP